MKNTVRKWISLSLLSLMLVKVWVIPLLYLDFEIRREYIVANLCINRDRPQMNCNGQCYLAKKMAALEEQEKRQAEQNYMSKLLDQVMDSRCAFTFPLSESVFYRQPAAMHFNYNTPFFSRFAADDIFHPPLC